MFWGILECLFWSDSESYCSGTVEFLSWNRGSTTCAMRCSPGGVFLWAVPPAQVNWWGRGCSSTAWPLAGSWGLEQAPTGHTIGMKSQYGWGLKVPLEIRWSSPPPSTGSAPAGCLALCPSHFWKFPATETPHMLSGQPALLSGHLQSKKSVEGFSMFKCNFLHFNLCPFTFPLWQAATETTLSLVFIYTHW